MGERDGEQNITEIHQQGQGASLGAARGEARRGWRDKTPPVDLVEKRSRPDRSTMRAHEAPARSVHQTLTSTSKSSDSSLLLAMKVLSRTPRLNQLPRHRKILISIFSSLPAFSTHVICGGEKEGVLRTPARNFRHKMTFGRPSWSFYTKNQPWRSSPRGRTEPSGVLEPRGGVQILQVGAVRQLSRHKNI